MNEMIGYIFCSLKSSEAAVRRIKKAMLKQTKFNKTVSILAVVMSAYMIAEEIHDYDQNRKIEKLTNEIKGLKRTEGD